MRACRYGLHLDVKSYFATIDHDILKDLLRRYVADDRALELLERIVDSTDYLAGRAGIECVEHGASGIGGNRADGVGA